MQAPDPSELNRDMAGPKLHNVDLNLLVSLRALLTERSVTKAAEALSVGQPTMSASLSKLRRLLNDPLLVKNGRRMELTPLAESLVEQVAEVLSQIESLMTAPVDFDPAISRRTFTLIADDYVQMMVVRPLLQEIDRIAPEISLHVLPTQPDQLEPLRNGLCDLAVWSQWLAPAAAAAFPSAELIADDFVGVVAEDNPEVGDVLTEEQIADMPYVHVTGGLPSTDPSAGARGIAPRNVMATTETFTSAAHMVADTRMYTVLQRRLFDRLHVMLGLRAVRLEVEITSLTEAMHWHPRRTDDAGHQWLRSALLRLAGDVS